MIIVRCEKEKKENDILLFFDTEKGTLHIRRYENCALMKDELNTEILNFLEEYKIDDSEIKIIHNSPVQNAYSAPIKLFIDITEKCNLNCKHCLNGHLNSNHHLSLNMMKKIADECCRLGIFYVKLGGGEPLLHPDFVDIIKVFRSKNIYLSLSSNGFYINDKVAELLYENKVRTTISIEGPERIDSVIRGKGHFQVALNAAQILKRKGVEVNFRVTLTKYLLDSKAIDELKKIAIEEQIKVKFAYCKPSGNALQEDMIIDINDKERYNKIIKILNDEDNKKYFILENGMRINQDKYFKDLYFLEKGCGAGNRTMHIDASGVISSCVFLRHWYDSSVNYCDTTIEEFWRNVDLEDNGALKMIRSISFPEECIACDRNCNGQCKALRLYNSGSMTGYNTNCLR